MKKRFRSATKIALACLVVVAVLPGTAILFSRQVLTVDSGPVKADVLVVLGGGGAERAARAAELFKAGEAPLIICSGLGDCDANQRQIKSKGVPAGSVTTECRSHSTSENARFTIPLLKSRGAKRVVIVTTWYHSRRALHCFQHYAPDIQFFSRPALQTSSDPTQTKMRVLRRMLAEYVKLPGYWFVYGVCPF